jgi:hypothetical protein
MKPVPYVPALHFDQVRAWVRARNEDITPDALPQTGFIIPGKAAGFLYRTDSSLAWIESLVAAPDLPKEERTQVVDLIVLAVCHKAKELGFRLLMGYTVLDAVVKRAERLGFDTVDGNFRLVILDLAKTLPE